MPPAHPFPVTALGMCTTLGGAVAACAAARAGLARPGTLDLPVFDDETGEEPAIGHPIPSLKGFQGRGRLVGLAWEALRELLGSSDVRPLAAECGFVLALPDLAERARAGAEQEEEDRVKRGPPEAPDVCDPLLALARLPIPAANRRVVSAGNVGFAAALREALAALEQRTVPACIVGAVDTLVDFSSLRWLAAAGRLKGPEVPTGLQPGEAAAFVLLELPEAARRRKSTPLAELAGASIAPGEEPAPDRPLRGTAMLAAVAEVLGSDEISARLPWWLSDQNGESDRAAEWGDFLVRCARRFPLLAGAAHWYPATAFGDTGVAAQAVASCMAVRALARRYAPAPAALVVGAARSGARAAIRVAEVR